MLSNMMCRSEPRVYGVCSDRADKLVQLPLGRLIELTGLFKSPDQYADEHQGQHRHMICSVFELHRGSLVELAKPFCAASASGDKFRGHE